MKEKKSQQKKIESLKKKQMEILELKNTISENLKIYWERSTAEWR